VHLDTCGDQSASEIGGLVGAQSADAAHISVIYKVERALAGIPELGFSVQGLTQSLYAHSKLEDTMLSTDVPALRARAVPICDGAAPPELLVGVLFPRRFFIQDLASGHLTDLQFWLIEKSVSIPANFLFDGRDSFLRHYNNSAFP
jgi:hypothetical protein